MITLGAGGAYVATTELRETIPGYRVTARDTTGAGDVFNGALAVALAERMRLMDAVRFANAAAAISVTRDGAQPAAPWRAEILELLGVAEPIRRDAAHTCSRAQRNDTHETLTDVRLSWPGRRCRPWPDRRTPRLARFGSPMRS